MRSKLAAALAFRQRGVVLKAISLAVDRLLDWALSGFCLLTLIISGGRSIIRRMRRVRGDDGTGEKQQTKVANNGTVLVMSGILKSLAHPTGFEPVMPSERRGDTPKHVGFQPKTLDGIWFGPHMVRMASPTGATSGRGRASRWLKPPKRR